MYHTLYFQGLYGLIQALLFLKLIGEKYEEKNGRLDSIAILFVQS